MKAVKVFIKPFEAPAVTNQEFFGGIPVYIATVYFSGTEEPSPWQGTLSVKFLGLKVSRLA